MANSKRSPFYLQYSNAASNSAHSFKESGNHWGDEGRNRRTQLNKLIRIWQDEMQFSQWEKVCSCTAIQPVILGSNANALLAAKLLDEAGYWIPAIRPPTVPQGSARLRITFSANHSEADLRQLITTLNAIEKQVIDKAAHE